jgi:hypothetical protein
MAEIMTKEPKGYGTHASMKGNASAADTKGERKGVFKHMVPSGKSEMVKGGEHKFDGGRHSGVCYTHDRSAYGK